MTLRRLALAGVLLLAGGLALLDAGRDAATVDEPLHVAASVALVRHGSWAIVLETPPLTRLLYGGAALAAGAREEPPLDFRRFYRSARAQLFGTPPSPRVLVAVRLVAVGLFVALLAAAAGAAGTPQAGLLAAALLAGQTALVPHGHLATTDLPASLAVVLAVWAALALEEKPGAARLAVAVLATALALATKQTALVLLGLLPLLLFIGAVRAPAGPERWRRLVAAGLLPLIAIAVLALLLHPLTASDPPGTLATLVRIFRLPPGDGARVLALERLSPGLARYLAAVLVVVKMSGEARVGFFLGQATAEPSLLYHPVAILVKSPLAWLVLVAAGTAAAFRRGGGLRGRLVLLAAGLFLASAAAGLQVGVRHVFPALALASVGAAAGLAPLLARRGPALLLVAVLLALSPLAFGRSLGRTGLLARLFPDPPLADSNLDWGQDLLRLASLARERDIVPSELGVAYFGGDLPALRIPGCVDLLEADGLPIPRHVAVSRQLLLGGPGSTPLDDARGRAARVLAALEAGGARRVGRAGDSIDLYEVAPLRP